MCPVPEPEVKATYERGYVMDENGTLYACMVSNEKNKVKSVCSYSTDFGTTWISKSIYNTPLKSINLTNPHAKYPSLLIVVFLLLYIDTLGILSNPDLSKMIIYTSS